MTEHERKPNIVRRGGARLPHPYLPVKYYAGQKVRKLIGFEAGEERRRYGDQGDDPRYDRWYPLMDWGMDREAYKRLIADAGLPVPVRFL